MFGSALSTTSWRHGWGRLTLPRIRRKYPERVEIAENLVGYAINIMCVIHVITISSKVGTAALVNEASIHVHEHVNNIIIIIIIFLSAYIQVWPCIQKPVLERKWHFTLFTIFLHNWSKESGYVRAMETYINTSRLCFPKLWKRGAMVCKRTI